MTTEQIDLAADRLLAEALHLGRGPIRIPKGVTMLKITSGYGEMIQQASELAALCGAGPYQSAVWGVRGTRGRFVARKVG